MFRALIGSQGTVGSTLLDHMAFDHVFNSDNIGTLENYDFDQVVVAAPSGNRLAINRGATNDSEDVWDIITAVKRARPAHVVLIGSVDAVTAPKTHYGNNRARLEYYLAESVPTTVLRLSTLIGSHIKKNVLHDIKYNLFLDKIDAGAEIQWCVINDLPRFIDQAQPRDVRNIVSEPIANWEILQRYRPELVPAEIPHSTVRYNQQPYCYSKQQIFAAMDEYML